MPRLFLILALLLCSSYLPLKSQEQKPAESGHYLFAWAGDVANKGNDFLAVIDADPSSASYGHLVTTVATDQQTKLIHHTEYTMPASGMLFANASCSSGCWPARRRYGCWKEWRKGSRAR